MRNRLLPVALLTIVLAAAGCGTTGSTGAAAKAPSGCAYQKIEPAQLFVPSIEQAYANACIELSGLKFEMFDPFFAQGAVFWSPVVAAGFEQHAFARFSSGSLAGPNAIVGIVPPARLIEFSRLVPGALIDIRGRYAGTKLAGYDISPNVPFTLVMIESFTVRK